MQRALVNQLKSDAKTDTAGHDRLLRLVHDARDTESAPFFDHTREMLVVEFLGQLFEDEKLSRLEKAQNDNHNIAALDFQL